MSTNGNTNAYASKAQQLPPAVQFAIITALPNCTNGAFWGFTSMDDAKEHIDVIKSDKNIVARQLGNACLIEVNPDYLYKACSVIDPSLMTQNDVAIMQKYMAEAAVSFEKFLYSKAEKGGFGGMVAIYCTNDSNAITYKNVQYPAFRLNIGTVLQYLQKWGYMILVGGQYVAPNVASQAGQALFSSMQLSPTNTGVFITIRSTYSPEQIKQLKAQYGITKPSRAKGK